MVMLIITLLGTIAGLILFAVEWPKVAKFFIRLLIKLKLKKHPKELFGLGIYWTNEPASHYSAIYNELEAGNVPIPRCPKSKQLLILPYDKNTPALNLTYMLCAECNKAHYFTYKKRRIALKNAIKIMKSRFQ